MFGRPIYNHTHGNLKPIRQLLEQKRRFVERRSADAYVETSHAFLKSYYTVALDYFPNSKFVHLVRHPLKTARSEANRERWVDSIHFPWRRYRAADGRKLFNWSLTGDEPIYQAVDVESPSLFQHYVIQWIEIENRAMRFLEEIKKTGDCITLHSPHDLNDPARVQQLIEQLGLDLAYERVRIEGKQNKTPGAKTTITSQEEDEFRAVVKGLPLKYLDIFTRPPYSAWEWVGWLRK